MTEKTLLRLGAAAGMTALAAWAGSTAYASEIEQRSAEGLVVIPESSQAKPGDVTHAHTNIRIFFSKGVKGRASEPSGKNETPASLACVYGLTKAVAGCNPESLFTVATGGSKIVAIVDAYDYPTAANDLGVFSSQFGLPPITKSNFQVVYAAGSKPQQDNSGGWELEEALDIEMAHAMAPDATVVLVEAASSSTTDLFAAETVAAKLVAAAGGGEVSNSWSGGEQANEAKFEKTFKEAKVVFLASAGDSHGIGVPAALQNVIAVGGTTINRQQDGDFISQTTWSQTGGGSSKYITIPAYQNPVADIVGTFRGTPDISLDANPSSGPWLYDTTPYNGQVLDWATVGGTSVSSPALAGILNNAGSFAVSTVKELTKVYKDFTKKSEWTDITVGNCGNNGGSSATAGWDFCSGVGVPAGLRGK